MAIVKIAFLFHFSETLLSCNVDKKQKFRKITFYKNYFQNFFDKQTKKVKAKIVWTFDLVEDLQRVPETYLKHIENTNGLYEIRVQYGKEVKFSCLQWSFNKSVFVIYLFFSD
jgi:hypothetical protein